jgi:uridylate kinase
MNKVVLSLGGSILVPTLESNNLKQYAAVLLDISRKATVFVVVGGGGEARRYIRAARALGINQASADMLGIAITRLNASLLISALGDSAFPRVAEHYEDAKEFSETGKIVVMGGVTPAQTTDAVSAVLAETVGAQVLINATSVDGVYSADPKKDENAIRFETLTPEELISIIMSDRLDAGSNAVIDIVAAKVVQRSGLPLVVLDGRDPDNIRKALIEGIYTGSIISKDRMNPLPL